MTGREGDGPELRIEALSCRPTGTAGRWNASWQIQNLGRLPVEIVSAWLPHDKFAAGRRVFEPPLRLQPMECTDLDLPVACDELPGSAVENAFLILQMVWLGRSWRVFTRHVVTLDDAGVPQHQCQAVTVQPVGFSAQAGQEPPQQG